MKENIEEVIKFLQGFNDGYTFQQCQTCFKFNEKDSCCNKEKCEELQAIEALISDYKRVLKENEELKSSNKKLERANKCYINSIHSIVPVLNQDYIEKQKIQDKIEEQKEEYKTELEKNSTRAFILKCQITILEDLLEEKGE